MGRPSRKWARFVSTVTTGRTSAGNITFLMSEPPAMSTPEASRSEALNQVQGRIPQKKNRRYGSISGPCAGAGSPRTRARR
jgi:hypothetical protein